MKLITTELSQALPPIGFTEDDRDPLVRAKFFTPWTSWTWYVTEYDGEDIAFGLVDGHEVELGYFSVSELEAIAGPHGLTIERDLSFRPKPLSAVRAAVARVREGPGATPPFTPDRAR